MIKIFRTSDGKCLRTSANKILRYNVPDITYANSKYGLLYNFPAVVDSRNIAPVGYHVPTKSEFETLKTFIGASVSGTKLKESGTTYWNYGNTGTNDYGFNARGGGQRWISGAFLYMLEYCYFKTTTVENTDQYILPSLNDLGNTLSIGYQNYKTTGSSLRLIKDDSTDEGIMIGTDGLAYRTVKIGNQVWMAENYKTTKYRDGSDIPNVTDNTTWSGLTTGAWCAYDNNLNNV